MSDPRSCGLGWPFKPVDEDPFVGVEVAPNEIVYVALAGDYRALAKAHADLLVEHERLRTAAQEQMQAAYDFLDVWKHYGPPK